VIDGLPADVITMNMATDINALADNGKLVPDNWVTRLPNNSAPFTSATVFIVRKGNPKALKDWPDLLKDGVQVIVPNPKTSGNGRYTYLRPGATCSSRAATRARPATSSASCSSRRRCSIPAAAPPPPPS
jgi:ABC-type sulfate transport system substrate-binding protein